VPHLFPRALACRRDPGHHEGILVKEVERTWS
jgi:hypothetical protein